MRRHCRGGHGRPGKDQQGQALAPVPAGVPGAKDEYEQAGDGEHEQGIQPLQQTALDQGLVDKSHHLDARYDPPTGRRQVVAQLHRRGPDDHPLAGHAAGVETLRQHVGIGDLVDGLGRDAEIDVVGAAGVVLDARQFCRQEGYGPVLPRLLDVDAPDDPVRVRPQGYGRQRGLVAERGQGFGEDDSGFAGVFAGGALPVLLEHRQDYAGPGPCQSPREMGIAVGVGRRAEVDVERDTVGPGVQERLQDPRMVLPGPWPGPQFLQAFRVDGDDHQIRGGITPEDGELRLEKLVVHEAQGPGKIKRRDRQEDNGGRDVPGL